MHINHRHVAIVRRRFDGLYEGYCSCDWTGTGWVNWSMANDSKDRHLKEIMEPAVPAFNATQWSAWMEVELPNEL